jgi:hypothetical protein
LKKKKIVEIKNFKRVCFFFYFVFSGTLPLGDLWSVSSRSLFSVSLLTEKRDKKRPAFIWTSVSEKTKKETKKKKTGVEKIFSLSF